jgi:hypothetical protein
MRVILLFVFSCFSLLSFGQDYNQAKTIHNTDVSKMSTIQKMEDTLVFLADSMLGAPIPEARVDGSYAFIKTIRRFLQEKESFGEPLKKLKEKIYIVDAPDKRLRIYTWEIIKATNDVRYYGVIQFNDGSYQPLIDVSDQMYRGAEDSVFTNMRWFGAIYYNIMHKKIGEVDAYFLMGYNGNSINGDKKIVDVFGFDGQGRGIFGAPLFNTIDGTRRNKNMRFILNYQKNAKVSLNFDEEKEMIIFDHCESSVGDMAKKNTYVPDGTYDGLKWDGRNWNMYTNVIEIMDLKQNNAPVGKPLNK